MSGAAAIWRASSARGCLNSVSSLRVSTRSSKYVPQLAGLARYYASKSFPPHTIVSMPALSPTMTSGNIGTWQKKAGDSIAPGDVLVEIETDKAQMDFEFQEEGTLAKILKESGEKDVAVGNPIAVMIEEGEDVSAFESFTLEDAGGEKAPPKEKPDQEAADASEPPSSSTKTAPAKEEKSEEPEQPESKESDSTGGKLEASLDREPKASPAAKKLALERGVALKSVKGTGPKGQVTKEDIEKFKPSGEAAPAAAAAGVSSFEDNPVSSMRKTIGTRLQQSWQENPHFYVTSSLSVTKLLKLRQALNTSADGKFKLSVNDFLVKAAAIACQKVPAVNSSWRTEGGQTVIRQYKNVDVSVAVATPVGLMTPIVKNAESIGLQSISSQIKELAKRARDGKLKPEEYQGGTFTISNMGQNDAVTQFTAIINPPQAAIIAVGTTRKVAVPADSEDGNGIEWDDQINVTAGFDHKVVDGAVGAEWIKAFKSVVENPLEFLL